MKIEEFERLDLRIGRIKDAARIEGSKKLIKLEVDIGSGDEHERNRQLVAGIADEYKPEELIGKLVPVLVNLEPKKLMGVESQGMLLAVSVDGKPVLLHPDKDVPPGSKVC
ncbi:MAG: methionine--tRNA ligase subunit beta [Methanophagales archaeon]|nr:methionine--tRNA ligase subunit beta [Methanophagales archaeon]